MRIPLIVTSVLALAAATAHAGGSPRSVGVGAEYDLFGLGGVSVNFDQGQFHVGGFLGFVNTDIPGNDDRTRFDLGARFYYHVHSTAMSDFGVGGGIGLRQTDNPDPIDDDADFTIDLGAQIRAFITSNVALSFGLGIGLASGDDDDDDLDDELVLTGQPTAIAGVHYYFF